MPEATCSTCGKDILTVTAQATGGLCRPCARKQHWQRLAAEQATAPSEGADDDLTPERAHARARGLMVEPWFWDVCDGDSPFGNDTGADTLSFFREWRVKHPRKEPVAFLTSLLRQWEVRDTDWATMDGEALRRVLPTDHFHVLTRDDTVIAVAFAQFALEGVVNPVVRERALIAVRRQALPEVIAFRGWVDPQERLKRLSRMKSVLEKA